VQPVAALRALRRAPFLTFLLLRQTSLTPLHSHTIHISRQPYPVNFNFHALRVLLSLQLLSKSDFEWRSFSHQSPLRCSAAANVAAPPAVKCANPWNRWEHARLPASYVTNTAHEEDWTFRSCPCQALTLPQAKMRWREAHRMTTLQHSSVSCRPISP
jgi:hypothetical protein